MKTQGDTFVIPGMGIGIGSGIGRAIVCLLCELNCSIKAERLNLGSIGGPTGVTGGITVVDPVGVTPVQLSHSKYVVFWLLTVPHVPRTTQEIKKCYNIKKKMR